MSAPAGTGSTAAGRVVAVGAVRSAATTTTALVLAAAWPGLDRPLLAEGDPAGGTLTAALGLNVEVGLVSLAAAGRRTDPTTRPNEARRLAEHLQLLPNGVPVLAGPSSPEQARNALAMLADLSPLLRTAGRDVLLDVGRLDPDSAAAPTFAGADARLLVVRPQLPDLQALAGYLDTHPDQRTDLVVVLVGPGPYPPREVSDALGTTVLGLLPWDPAGVAALGAEPRRGLSRLHRAATMIAGLLASGLDPAEQAPLTRRPADGPGAGMPRRPATPPPTATATAARPTAAGAGGAVSARPASTALRPTAVLTGQVAHGD
jgi:hypothetical protein